MVYLVISEEYDAEPHANTGTWARVESQHERLAAAADEAIRLRNLRHGDPLQGPIRVQEIEEPLAGDLSGRLYRIA